MPSRQDCRTELIAKILADIARVKTFAESQTQCGLPRDYVIEHQSVGLLKRMRELEPVTTDEGGAISHAIAVSVFTDAQRELLGKELMSMNADVVSDRKFREKPQTMAHPEDAATRKEWAIIQDTSLPILARITQYCSRLHAVGITIGGNEKLCWRIAAMFCHIDGVTDATSSEKVYEDVKQAFKTECSRPHPHDLIQEYPSNFVDDFVRLHNAHYLYAYSLEDDTFLGISHTRLVNMRQSVDYTPVRIFFLIIISDQNAGITRGKQ